MRDRPELRGSSCLPGPLSCTLVAFQHFKDSNYIAIALQTIAMGFQNTADVDSAPLSPPRHAGTRPWASQNALSRPPPEDIERQSPRRTGHG